MPEELPDKTKRGLCWVAFYLTGKHKPVEGSESSENDGQEYRGDKVEPLRAALAIMTYCASPLNPLPLGIDRELLYEACIELRNGKRLDEYIEMISATWSAILASPDRKQWPVPTPDTPKEFLSKNAGSLWLHIKDMVSIPPVDQLEVDLRMGRKTIYDSLKELREKGWILPS
jgi:hypothetical protein